MSLKFLQFTLLLERPVIVFLLMENFHLILLHPVKSYIALFLAG